MTPAAPRGRFVDFDGLGRPVTQLETGAASTYVFRGRTQYTSRKDPSSQSTVGATIKSVGPGDFNFTAWNASTLARHPQLGNASEVDLTPSYTVSSGENVAVTAGYIAYLYPQHLSPQPVDGQHEVFGVLAIPNRWVTPSVSVFAEVVRLHGAYAAAMLARTFTMGSFQITPQASIGAAGYAGVATRLNDVSAMVIGQWNIIKPFYVNVRGAYSYEGGPAIDLPTPGATFANRSVPWAMLAVGMAH